MQEVFRPKKARQKYTHGFVLIAVFGMLLLAVPPQAAAETTVYVDAANTTGPWDGTSSYPYQTIGDAVAVAEASIIYVSAGTYSENVVITHSLCLIGASALTTVIDGGSHGHAVYAAGTEDAGITLSITGFTIQHAGQHGFANLACSYVSGGTIEGTTIQYSQEGDGIQLDHCTNLAIRNTIVSNAYVSGISLTLSSSCTLDGNTIRYNQKGISLGYSTANRITANAVSHNTVYGVYIYQSSQNEFAHNTFSMNGQQASDPCSNAWSIDQQGNSWDDYSGFDSDHNGIGDVPYSIPGGSNVDNYPLGIFQSSPSPGEDNSPPAVLSMIVTPLEAFAGDPVSFTGEGYDSDGIIQGYSWQSSRDGRIGTAKTFTSTSLSAGVHTISFSVQDNDGTWSSTQTTTMTVKVSPAAVIDGITPMTAYVNQPVAFQGHAENAEGLVIQYQWSSSQDGILSGEAVFTRSNLSCGVHAVSFRVRMAGRDWSSPATQLLTVQLLSPENRTVVADAGGPYHGSVGEPVLLNASRSSSSTDAALSYSWDFGDGATGSGRTVSHAYSTPGNYSVALTVSTAGDFEVSTVLVTVSAASSQEDPSEASNGLLPSLLPIPLFLGLGVISVIGGVGVLVWRRRRS